VHEADHSCPSRAEVGNEWSYTSVSSRCAQGHFTFYHGKYWSNYLIIHDTCTWNAETLTDERVIIHGDYWNVGRSPLF
jgi:hypothetical protein